MSPGSRKEAIKLAAARLWSLYHQLVEEANLIVEGGAVRYSGIATTPSQI